MRLRPRPWAGASPGPWRESTLSVIDVETTGLDPARDEVVSIGVATVQQARVVPATWYCTVRPQRPSSPTSMRVHALMPADLDDAPALDDVLGELRDRVEGTLVVAHAAWIERAFLDRALRPRGERLADAIVDTALLADHLGLGAGAAHAVDLEWLAGSLGLPAHTPHHALGDAFTTAVALLALCSRIEQGRAGPVSTEQLLRLSRPLRSRSRHR